MRLRGRSTALCVRFVLHVPVGMTIVAVSLGIDQFRHRPVCSESREASPKAF